MYILSIPLRQYIKTYIFSLFMKVYDILQIWESTCVCCFEGFHINLTDAVCHSTSPLPLPHILPFTLSKPCLDLEYTTPKVFLAHTLKHISLQDMFYSTIFFSNMKQPIGFSYVHHASSLNKTLWISFHLIELELILLNGCIINTDAPQCHQPFPY